MIVNLAQLEATYKHSLSIRIDREEGRFSCDLCPDEEFALYDGLDRLERAAVDHALTLPLDKDDWTDAEWRQDQRERSQPDFGRECG